MASPRRCGFDAVGAALGSSLPYLRKGRPPLSTVVHRDSCGEGTQRRHGEGVGGVVGRNRKLKRMMRDRLIDDLAFSLSVSALSGHPEDMAEELQQFLASMAELEAGGEVSERAGEKEAG